MMKPTLQNIERRLNAIESHPLGAQEPLTIRLNEVDHEGNTVTTAWETTRHTNPRTGVEFFLELPVGEAALGAK